MKFYFTFGQDHIHRLPNTLVDRDCVIEIHADSYKDARLKMFDTFGRRWAFQYENIPNMNYFPRGIFNLNGDKVDKPKEK